jgi:hypothetical protein
MGAQGESMGTMDVFITKDTMIYTSLVLYLVSTNLVELPYDQFIQT